MGIRVHTEQRTTIDRARLKCTGGLEFKPTHSVSRLLGQHGWRSETVV
jgi:hypothetical protein